MGTNVGQLTTEELKETIGAVVEEKVKEILGRPDDGLGLRTEVRERLPAPAASVRRRATWRGLERDHTKTRSCLSAPHPLNSLL